MSSALSREQLNELINAFPNKSIFLAGCYVKEFNYDYCLMDVFVYPSEEKLFYVDRESKIAVRGVSEKQHFLKEEVKILYDPSFSAYQLFLEKEAYMKNVLEKGLKESLNFLSNLKLLGPTAIYAAAGRLIEPAVVLSESSLSPSHVFRQINKKNHEYLNVIFESLQIDSNMGEILKARAEALTNFLPKDEAKLFFLKIDSLIKNKKELEASVYFFHQLSKLSVSSLKDLSQYLKFGQVEEKTKKRLLELIAELTKELNDL